MEEEKEEEEKKKSNITKINPNAMWPAPVQPETVTVYDNNFLSEF